MDGALHRALEQFADRLTWPGRQPDLDDLDAVDTAAKVAIALSLRELVDELGEIRDLLSGPDGVPIDVKRM